MVIEIDQSNKIEQTDKDTIIGLSNVRFGNIGKKSNAHCISYFSRKGQKYKPNKEIGFDELRKLCFKQKPDA